MAERLATHPRDDEALTTVMHPTPETTAPGHPRAAPLTLEEEAALLSMEHHYHDPVDPPGDLPPTGPPPGGSGEGDPSDPGRSPTVLDLVMVDQSQDARDFARDAAETRLTNELNEGGRFKRFVKGIWKGNIAKEYYRQKYIKEAQGDIQSTQDVLIHETSIVSKRGRAKAATIERFQQDYSEMINTGAGENRNKLADNSELAVGLKGIIRDYAEGRTGDAALGEEFSRFITAYREANGTDLVGEGLVQTSNYIEIAKAAKGAIENGESVDNVIGNMRIITGEARTGARSEARYNKADKAIEWLGKRRITSIIPESAIITGTAIASGILRIGSTKTLGAIGQTLIPGAGGALIAGLREWKQVKDERTQHSREMAVGKMFNSGDKRREDMDKTRYETISAQSLTDMLRGHHESIFTDDADRPAGQTKDGALQAALDALTAVEVRNAMSDSQKMDLISYSNIENVGDERMQLALARAKLKVALRQELDVDARTRLSIDGAASIDDLIESGSQSYIDTINDDLSSKNKAFRSLRNRRVAVAAATGLAVGLTIGLASQEVIMGALDSTRAGLVEQLWNAENKPINGTDHQTILHGIINGDKTAEHHPPSSEYTKLEIGDKATLEMSSDHGIQHNADGTVDIINPDGKTVVENLPVNADHTLSQESIKILESHGMIVEDTSFPVEVITKEARTVDFDSFMDNHKGDTTEVTRTGWWENNTSAPRYDKNELGVQWGGKDGNGITKNGFQLNLNGMTEKGSFQDGKSVNFRELNEQGNLKFAVSPTKDTQTTPFLLDIKPDGSIDIPKDGPAAQFFAKEDGEAVFTGQYGEVVEMAGKNEDGVEQIRPLATIVGTGDAEGGPFQDIVPVKTTETYTSYRITSPGYETPGTYTEMAPVIPILSRRSMERLTRTVDLTNPNLEGFYYGGGSLENLRSWIAASPDRLRTRREVTNADGTKTWLEADGSLVERSVDRERAVLQNYLNNERATNPNHYRMIETVAASLGTMDNKSRVAVNVPAWMEEGNLKHFLSEYTAQVDKDGNPLDPSLYEINIIVNRKTGTTPDESVRVINEFVADFESTHGFKPRVNYADVELDPPFNNVGYARKLLTDAVALRSVQRTGQTEPLYMESEDADMIRVDKKTIVNLFTKLDANPQLDALRGVQDRSPEYMKENDMLFLRRRAWDFFEIMARDKRFRDPTSPDWNFTWNRTVTGGWNTGYTAESYGLIGGYDSVPAGEDMSVGEKITMIRGDGNVPNLEVVGTVASRSDSSPRRFINEIAADKGAYADFTNEADNKHIREKSIPELLDSIKEYSRINDTNKDSFESYISGTFNWAMSATPTRADAEQFSHRLLFFLGFKKSDYDIVGDGIKVKSWDNVKDALENYRVRTATS